MNVPAATSARRYHHEGGYALIEAIVALAVLASFAAFLVRSVSDAGETTQRAHDWLMARLVAEALMAEAFSSTALGFGRMEGVKHGYHWSASAQPYGEASGRGADLVAVQVTVDVTDTTSLSLHSLRMGAPR